MGIRNIMRIFVLLFFVLAIGFIVLNRNEKIMKHKDVRKIVRTVLIIFLVVWVVMFSVDVWRFKDWFKPPVFARPAKNDSNYYSYKYEGLFYQIYFGGDTWNPENIDLSSPTYGKITIGFDFLKSVFA